MSVSQIAAGCGMDGNFLQPAKIIDTFAKE